MTNELQAALISGGTVLVGGIVTVITVWRTARSEERKASASSPAENMDAMSGGFQRLVADLQEQRKQDRYEMKGMATKLDAMEDRLRRHQAESWIAEDKCFRNINALQDHITRCCTLMRGAGIDPPAAPVLET